MFEVPPTANIEASSGNHRRDLVRRGGGLGESQHICLFLSSRYYTPSQSPPLSLGLKPPSFRPRARLVRRSSRARRLVVAPLDVSSARSSSSSSSSSSSLLSTVALHSSSPRDDFVQRIEVFFVSRRKKPTLMPFKLQRVRRRSSTSFASSMEKTISVGADVPTVANMVVVVVVVLYGAESFAVVVVGPRIIFMSFFF